MNTKTIFSSSSNEWGTPQFFYDNLNNEFNFTLDPCSTAENAKCEKFYTIEDDGLSMDWGGETVFCNPPYGRDIKYWVEKSYKEASEGGATVVMLIPARTDTKYWHEYIFDKAEIRFLKGRLKFEKDGEPQESAPFPSAVVIFKPFVKGE